MPPEFAHQRVAGELRVGLIDEQRHSSGKQRRKLRSVQRIAGGVIGRGQHDQGRRGCDRRLHCLGIHVPVFAPLNLHDRDASQVGREAIHTKGGRTANDRLSRRYETAKAEIDQLVRSRPSNDPIRGHLHVVRNRLTQTSLHWVWIALVAGKPCKHLRDYGQGTEGILIGVELEQIRRRQTRDPCQILERLHGLVAGKVKQVRADGRQLVSHDGYGTQRSRRRIASERAWPPSPSASAMRSAMGPISRSVFSETWTSVVILRKSFTVSGEA